MAELHLEAAHQLTDRSKSKGSKLAVKATAPLEDPAVANSHIQVPCCHIIWGGGKNHMLLQPGSCWVPEGK